MWKKLLILICIIPGIANALEISTSSTNLGIGTTSTVNQLGVVSGLAVGSTSVNTTAPVGGIITDGNVGIGSVTPITNLDVKGNSNFSGTFSTGVWLDCTATPNADGSICSNQGTITTTGNINTASNSLSVASATGWAVGMGIIVSTAGNSGGSTDLTTYVTAISGTTLTLKNASANSSNLSGVTIYHDEFRALGDALATGKNIHIRAGNYRYIGLLNQATLSEMVIGDGVVGRGLTSSGISGTNLMEASTTTGAYKISAGYTTFRDLSVQMYSGVTPAATTYGVSLVTSGATSDRAYDIENILIYNFNGGLAIGTSALSSTASFGYFNNINIGVATGSTIAGFYLNDSSPAGDNRFTNIDIRLALSATTGTYGIQISGADLNIFDNIKVTGAFTNSLLIDALSSAVEHNKFLNSSFENASGDCVVLSPTNAFQDIVFSVDNFGICGSLTNNGITISGGQNISVSNSNFYTIQQYGISVTGTAGGFSFIGNNFDGINTAAFNFGSASTTGISLIGNSYISGGAGVSNPSGNTHIIRIDGKAGTDGISIGTSAAPSNKLQVYGSIGIGTTGKTSYLTTTAPPGGLIMAGNLGIGIVNPGQALDVAGTVRFSSSLINTNSATGIGWSEHNATNQACNTTCGTSACVIGLDIGTVGVVNSGFVGCPDATADDCICAGP